MSMSAKNEPHTIIEATITRADGTKETLGIISMTGNEKKKPFASMLKKLGGK